MTSSGEPRGSDVASFVPCRRPQIALGTPLRALSLVGACAMMRRSQVSAQDEKG